MALKEVISCIEEDLQQVEQAIASHLQSEVDFILTLPAMSWPVGANGFRRFCSFCRRACVTMWVNAPTTSVPSSCLSVTATFCTPR